MLNQKIKQQIFGVKVFEDGKEVGKINETTTSYERAKEMLKKLAEDFEYGFTELGKHITCRCTFGGLSKGSTPICQQDRAEHPNALLLYVQRVASAKRVTRVVYELYMQQQ